MGKKVVCEFEGCETRVAIDQFDESIWLPLFEASREHIGYCCPSHVQELRDGKHSERYVLTRAGADELIIELSEPGTQPNPSA